MIRKLTTCTLFAALTLCGAAARAQSPPVSANWLDEPAPRVAFVDDAPPRKQGIVPANTLANQAFQEPPHADVPMILGQPVIPGAGRPDYEFLQEEGYPFNHGMLNSPHEHLGWFSTFYAGIVLPQLHTETVSPELGNLRTPSADMAWNVMGTIEVGYRFEDGLGDARLSFRHLEGHGSQIISGDGVRTDLYLNVLDLDYCCTELHMARWPRIPLLPLNPARLGMGMDMESGSYGYPMQLRWTWGWRVGQAYFDNRHDGVGTSDRTVNNFRGGGLNWAVRGTKAMPWNHLAWCAKWGASGMIGNVDQDFYQTVGGVTTAATGRDLIGVPTMDGELGIAYVPNWRNATCRISGGYMVEQWWCIGETDVSGAELLINGFFFRGELNY
jgi:hypothetical protein